MSRAAWDIWAEVWAEVGEDIEGAERDQPLREVKSPWTMAMVASARVIVRWVGREWRSGWWGESAAVCFSRETIASARTDTAIGTSSGYEQPQPVKGEGLEISYLRGEECECE